MARDYESKKTCRWVGAGGFGKEEKHEIWVFYCLLSQYMDVTGKEFGDRKHGQVGFCLHC